MHHRTHLGVGLLAWGMIALSFSAEARAERPTATPLESLLSHIARDVALAELPERFTDESDWDHEKTFTSRLRLAGKPLKPKIEKVKTQKRHGTWTRFMGHIPDPEKNLQVNVQNLRTKGEETRFEVITRFPITGEAELQQWARGVQLLGVSVVADAELEIQMELRLVTRLVPTPLLATADLFVEVTSAEIEMTHFKIQRIGQADGKGAEWVGDQVKASLKRKVARRREKLVTQANKAIQRQMDQGKLRLDPYQLVQHLWRSKQ